MIEGCKWTLTCHPSRCLENNSAESYVDYGGPVQELFRENNIGNWAREGSCDILRGKKNNKKLPVFSPCPKNFPEAKFKSIFGGGILI